MDEYPVINPRLVDFCAEVNTRVLSESLCVYILVDNLLQLPQLLYLNAERLHCNTMDSHFPALSGSRQIKHAVDKKKRHLLLYTQQTNYINVGTPYRAFSPQTKLIPYPTQGLQEIARSPEGFSCLLSIMDFTRRTSRL